jgi:hypothetical protein
MFIHNLIDIGLFMAFHKAFLEQCILKCFLTLILVGGHKLIPRFVWQFVYLLVEASASVLDPCMWN